MIYVRHHKTFYSSDHAVVTMAQEEMERLETFFKLRKQPKTNVANVFVSWTGSETVSVSISTQLWSLWQKIGILSKSGKGFVATYEGKVSELGLKKPNINKHFN